MKTAIFILVATLLGCSFAILGHEDSIVQNTIRNHERIVLPAFRPLTGPAENVDVNEIIAKFVAEKLGNVEYMIKDQYKSKHNGVTHTYLRQLVNGKEVFNADLNINILPDGSIINYGENFFKGENVEFLTKFSPLDVVKTFAAKRNVNADDNQILSHINENVIVNGGNLAIENIPMRLGYIQTETGKLDLAWELVVREPVSWFYVVISASENKILQMVDWTHAETYEVYRVPEVNDPLDGDRTVEVSPSALGNFELGWHSTGNTNFTTTYGNNVEAMDNSQIFNPVKYSPEGGAGLNFEFPIDLTLEPQEYLDASVTNLFYTCNVVHDIFHLYGFDEVSGNFQRNNFGLGGRDNDPVIAYAHDGLGMNNAMFSSPPDGSSGTMRMYLWNTQGNPLIDGSLDNGIIIHEYGHGINIRLSGGPSNSNCMSGGEAGGMGEGWGDCWSLMLRWREEYDINTMFEMGEYAAGYGIRLYPYAYNMTVNPQTYEYINGPQYSGVHAKGTFFCAALYDTFVDMVDKYGYEDYYNPRNMGGNNILLQNTVDSLKLQPCNPSMIESRDALIMADEINYGGAHVCDIWRNFGRRGVGVFAQSTTREVTEDFTIPNECL